MVCRPHRPTPLFMHGMSATLAHTRGFRPLISPSNILSHGNYQRLIPNYATVAQPLLTAKAYSNVVWTDEFTVTFEQLKQLLCSVTILCYPSPTY